MQGVMPPVILCPACDLAHRRTATPSSGRTRCARCRAPLQRPESAAIETAIALGLCALVLFWLGNAYPLVAMHVGGSSRATTLMGAARGLYDQNYKTLGALVFLTTVIAPLLQVTVRLSKFAHVVPGIALWCCGLLMLCLSALASVTSPEQLWRWAVGSQE